MLEVGKIYQFRERIQEGKNAIIRRRPMRLVKKYPHHMLFETLGGIRECFTYWDAGRKLAGEDLFMHKNECALRHHNGAGREKGALRNFSQRWYMYRKECSL